MTISNFDAEKRLKKYREAFAESGWNLHASGKGLADKIDNLEGPAFYLCDLVTVQLIVVATAKGVFDLAEEHKRNEGFAFQTICDCFGSLYTDITEARIKLDMDVSNLLAIAVAMYISGTQGHKHVVEQGRADMHYLVIRHWDYLSNTWMLRPVPIAPKPYYPPEIIESIVDEVLSIDRQNHPQRFKSAKVIPFKVKHRKDCTTSA
jgi:hypothetical protein